MWLGIYRRIYPLSVGIAARSPPQTHIRRNTGLMCVILLPHTKRDPISPEFCCFFLYYFSLNNVNDLARWSLSKRLPLELPPSNLFANRLSYLLCLWGFFVFFYISQIFKIKKSRITIWPDIIFFFPSEGKSICLWNVHREKQYAQKFLMFVNKKKTQNKNKTPRDYLPTLMITRRQRGN